MIRTLIRNIPARFPLASIMPAVNPGSVIVGKVPYFYGAVVVKAIDQFPFSTAVHARHHLTQQDNNEQLPTGIAGMDQYHLDDVIGSIQHMEIVLGNLQITQERQRKLFHEEADTLIPAGNSRMSILFEEASLQQSILRKCLNNIKINFLDAEKPLLSSEK